MTYLKNLTGEQKIDYITLLQNKIRLKYKKELKKGLLSGYMIKKEIIDKVVWDNQDKHLYIITNLVLGQINNYLKKRNFI